MTDIIRKAVELAAGWSMTETGLGTYRLCYGGWGDMHPIVAHDALAAQLVRQVDALPRIRIEVEPTYAKVIKSGTNQETLGFAAGDDRTTNTLRAIIESKVLE